MAGKEINSSFPNQEVRSQNEKNKYSPFFKRQITRRTALVLTSALYLADSAVHVNAEATPTPTPTPVPKEAVKIDGISTTIDEQTIDRWVPRVGAFGSLLSGLGLFTAAYALFQLRRQAKATEDAAKLSAADIRFSNYERLMAMGDSINSTFLEHPELYNQLFEKPHVGPESTKRVRRIKRDPLMDTQVRAAALRFADYFELTLDFMDSIPEHLQDNWVKYMKTCLKNSQYLRNLIRDTDWYGVPIKQLCVEAEQEMERETAASVQREQRFQRVRRLTQPILNILRKR